MRRKTFAAGDGGLFWICTAILCGLIAGGIFSFVISELAGQGFSSGLMIGTLIFVVTSWLFGRFAMGGPLPAPNTVKAPRAPAGGKYSIPGGAPSTPRSSRPRPMPDAHDLGVSVGQSLQNARETISDVVSSAGDAVSDAARAARDSVVGAAGSAAGAAGSPASASDPDRQEAETVPAHGDPGPNATREPEAEPGVLRGEPEAEPAAPARPRGAPVSQAEAPPASSLGEISPSSEAPDAGSAPDNRISEPIAEPSAAPMSEDAASGDGDAPAIEEGHEPARLDAARNGDPDDLRRISGIGPVIQEKLNDLGVYHYDQIAAWSDEEVTWVERHLEGFQGRVTRDAWVDQARTLTSGGQSDFADRVDKGDVS